MPTEPAEALTVPGIDNLIVNNYPLTKLLQAGPSRLQHGVAVTVGVLTLLAATMGGFKTQAQQPAPIDPGEVRSAPTVKAPARPPNRTAIAPMAPDSTSSALKWSETLPPFPPGLLDELKREDAQPGLPRPRIGLSRPLSQPIVVSSNTVATKDWTVLPNGWRIWSASVGAQGAIGIRVHLESVALPAGARLLAYDPAQPARTQEPIMAAELSDQNDVWTRSVFAENVTLECEVPPGQDVEAIAFTVRELSHQYRTAVVNVLPPAMRCENDATCYPLWANQEAAIARITFMDQGEEYLCSGCLLNHNDTNVVADYFLTANHCIENQTVASTIEFLWLYQTATCNDPNSAPCYYSGQSTFGATLLATLPAGTGNDFSFLQLSEPPPDGVYYAGWTTALPPLEGQVTGIHHPGLPPDTCAQSPTDYSRISFGNRIGVMPLPSSTDPFGAWEVQWSSGITEDGSSGSPLFDANQLVVGQLYGGTSTCTDQSGPDVYGRFDTTFHYVRQWLDPIATGSFNGLFYNTNDMQVDSSGYVRVTVGPQGGYVGALRLRDARYPLSGQFGSNNVVTQTIVRPGTTPLTVTLSLAASTNLLTGTVSNAAWQAQLSAPLAVYNALINPAPQKGRYTLLILGGTNGAASPTGDGVAAVSVTTSGVVTLAGSLADGAPIADAALLSQTGQWPLFVPLYGGLGSILGWMKFDTNQSPPTLQGVLNWIRPAIPAAKFYRVGFTNTDTIATGAAYAGTNPVVSLTNGAFIFSGGNLAVPATNSVVLRPNNQLIASNGSHLNVTITLTNGLLNGTALLPDAGQRVQFHGAILQSSNSAYGYFLGTNQEGSVSLQSQ